MDASETLAGKRGRAPVVGAMDSDSPAQSLGKECRAGDLHSAFVSDKEVMRGHVQWRHLELEENIETQARRDPVVPLVMNGGGPNLSAWVAEECKRVLRRDFTEEAERVYADLAGEATDRELDAWKQFKVSSRV